MNMKTILLLVTCAIVGIIAGVDAASLRGVTHYDLSRTEQLGGTNRRLSDKSGSKSKKSGSKSKKSKEGGSMKKSGSKSKKNKSSKESGSKKKSGSKSKKSKSESKSKKRTAPLGRLAELGALSSF